MLGLRFSVTPLSLVALLGALAVGAVGIVAVGLVLAGCAMVFARQSMMMNEGVSAVLYLFCGSSSRRTSCPRSSGRWRWRCR